MKLNRLDIGVIGCGHLGDIHCRILKELSEHDSRINFAGLYDIDSEVSLKASSAFGVKNYSGLEELLNQINTLLVVTPTSTHYEIARRALEKGKNVFIEKPVTSEPKDARELIILSDSSKVTVQVGHVERFNPALLSLSNYELEPKFIEAHRLAQFNPRGTDVSVIHDLMIHDIDIILNLVRSPVETVDANGVAVISDKIDIANARIRFQNGCVANVTASRISLKKMRKMRIFQSNSYISVDFLNNEAEVFKLADADDSADTAGEIRISDKKKLVHEKPVKAGPGYDVNPIKEELTSFFESILENKPVRVTLKEATQALELSEQIDKGISNRN